MTYVMKPHDSELTIHHYDENGVYRYSESGYKIPAGTGLPAQSTHITPPEKWDENKALVFDEEAHVWKLVDDYRKYELYDTRTAQRVIMEELGPLPEHYTVKAPTGELVKWEEGNWVLDVEAIKEMNGLILGERKRAEMAYASEQIAILADAIDLDMATNDETAFYNELRRFRIQLSRIDPHNPPEVWPEIPALFQTGK
ncbi:TPA: tail fiber assembly protein [Enterobacter hormaechei subsp. xiangfangensis]|nr:tail fiber assembly protein [Enterobacter hormaechei subsp. xiangfangensis]